MGANGAYLAAARRAADVVVQRGLLRKVRVDALKPKPLGMAAAVKGKQC
jgi:hypothetical protein